MSDQIGKLIESVKAQEIQSLAKLLSQLEAHGEALFKYPELLSPPQKSLRIGITGPPGAGKSTLIGGIISELRKRQLSVGVIAVDPSSPISQGAILGDRIRYAEHFLDEKVFIRSLGTRGSLGGLSAAAYLMLRAYDLFNFDVVIIETVGVGQTELEVVHVADVVSVVLVPESGDSIQAMKAGLLEVADIFVLNKADRPGADSLANEIKINSPQKEIFKTVATESKGIAEFVNKLLELKGSVSFQDNRSSIKYLQNEARSILRRKAQIQIDQKVVAIQNLEDFNQLLTK